MELYLEVELWLKILRKIQVQFYLVMDYIIIGQKRWHVAYLSSSCDLMLLLIITDVAFKNINNQKDNAKI